ncbi:alpha-protein kinase 1 [Dunckerocampus dactyliophorus]|uniref:alpha-protein kinase 1 n=1 Tax=Dunckerocampus dactyliophorus TaxID=161453 RepID=UPI00240567B4|nr:alpha-protein kinase 1 [Dunckerocampus dactyliophorus]
MNASLQTPPRNLKVKQNLKPTVRMAGPEVGVLLEDCLRSVTAEASIEDTDRQKYCSLRDSLCAELASLLQEAMEMRWPFVPEKWQYKQSICTDDKTNLSDLISQHLPQLLNVLKASIVAQEAHAALAVIFLVDRFLYWTDESSRLLEVAKLLHKRYPVAPVAPQLVIRRARVYLNSGKLQKAEYILSHLIISSGATGYWVYGSESDRALVQAVSLQVRGMVLQKLGLWLEAALLVWASLVGYYALPQPDKKGIGTSLGILANILVSMNDEDFSAFKANPDIDLSLLGDASHRLLSAAKAAKMAVVYSQYTSLYVLTNATAQGTCLLSYSFSVACPPTLRKPFLLQAKKAFEIGLLTKADGEVVTSKQELHTFIKAAYSLVVTHKWLSGSSEAVKHATQACQEALAHFYRYCHPHTQERGGSCVEIMRLIAQVKLELQVEPFVNSDDRSFIPDSYRNISDTLVGFTMEVFSKLLQRFQKYHASLCGTTEAKCKAGKEEEDGARMCMTALGTTVDAFNTECMTDACKPSKEDAPRPPDSGSVDGLSSSWQKLSLKSSRFPRLGSSGGYSGRSAAGPENVGSATFLKSERPDTSLCSSRGSDKFEVIEAEIPTVDSDVADDDRGPEDGAPQSLSQLILRSSSLSNSFGSKSSGENISAGSRSRTAGTRQSSKSSETSGSFFLMRTQDSETSDPECDPTSEWEFLGIPKRVDTPNVAIPEECSSTEFSTQDSHGVPEEVTVDLESLNPWCHSCLKHNAFACVAPEGKYSLSQEDYKSLLAGVCHECLLKRLQSNKRKFQLDRYSTAHSALHLKFSKATGLWTARETCAYIGQLMNLHGTHRSAIWVQFLHQEERLSSYVGKDYRKPTQIQFHLRDVERQMTAQYYVTEFNKRLYDKEVMAQMFFLPSEVLLILEGDEIAGCITVEPYMLGQFVKLTNNKEKKNNKLPATEYGLAFGHFTYLHSNCQEVVVDLQGWVTASGKGLTYLTDPQIHSTRTSRGPNFVHSGITSFLRDQHGPECNSVCQLLNLKPVPKQ